LDGVSVFGTMFGGAMRQRTTRGTIVAGVAGYLLLFAVGSWRAQHEDVGRGDVARLADTDGHAEVRNEWASLRNASGATGELPDFYEQQWVPLIGVLVQPPENRVRRHALRDLLTGYARGAPNFCRGTVRSSGTLGSCLVLQLDFSALEAGEREYQALLASFLPAVRATAEGLVAERVAAWEKELARRGAEAKAEEKRD
jgi:hypothetical protein